MTGSMVLPFVVEGKIHELDYLTRFRPLEAAVKAWVRRPPSGRAGYSS